MDISRIFLTLKSLEASQKEILSSLESLKHLLEQSNSINLKLSLLEEDVLRCMVGILRCCHGNDDMTLMVLRCIDLAIHGCEEVKHRLYELDLITLLMALLKQENLKKSSSYLEMQELLVSVARKAICNYQPSLTAFVSDGGVKRVLGLLDDLYPLSIDAYPPNTKDRLAELTVGNCFIAAVNRVPSATKATLSHLFPSLSSLGKAFIQDYPLFYIDLLDVDNCYISNTLVSEELALPYDVEHASISSRSDDLLWIIMRVTHVSGPVQIWAEFSVDQQIKEKQDLFDKFQNEAPPQPSDTAVPSSLTLGSLYSIYNSISLPDVPVGWYRGLLLQSTNKTVHEFFCIDYGFTVRCVGKRCIRQLPPQFKGVPPRVAPCVLASIKPPIRSVKLLEDCCGILRNLSIVGDIYHRELLSRRVGPILLELISSKSVTVETLRHVVICLMNFSKLSDLGKQICEIGGIQTLTDILVNFTHDLELLTQKYILQCLGNLLMVNKSSSITFKRINGPKKLMEWATSIKDDQEIGKYIEELLDFIANEEKPDERYNDSTFSSLIAAANYVSPTSEKPSPKSNNSSATKGSPVYRLQSQDNRKSHVTEQLMKRLPTATVPPMEYGSRLTTTPKHAYEYIDVDRISDISSGHILRSMCGLANNVTEGAIYIGIVDDTRVKGIRLSRNQKDSIRIDVDRLVTQLKPPIIPSRYTISFIPVFNSPRNGDQFVVAIKIIPSNSTTVHVLQRKKTDGKDSLLEECYIHRNGRSIKMSILDVREMVAEQIFLEQNSVLSASP